MTRVRISEIEAFMICHNIHSYYENKNYLCISYMDLYLLGHDSNNH